MNKKSFIKKLKSKMEQDFSTPGRLGATIKHKRKGLGATLSRLSIKNSVSVSYLSKVENDNMKPNLQHISGVLNELQINEEMFMSSQLMDGWYLKLIEHVLGLNDFLDELEDLVSQRTDFQAQLLKFALDVHLKRLGDVDKLLSLLMHNIDNMTAMEISIFTLSVARNYMHDKDYFTANQVIAELNHAYLYLDILEYWHQTILFDLSFYQSSFELLNKRFESMSKFMILYDQLDYLKEARERYILGFSYFLKPNNIEALMKHKQEYEEIYLLSLLFNNELEAFLETSKFDVNLSTLIYYDLTGRKEELLEIIDDIIIPNDPYLMAIKTYLDTKYLFDREMFFLKDTVFSDFGIAHHYHAAEFFSTRLSALLNQDFKYKESGLVYQRLITLQKENSKYVKQNSVI